MEMTEALMDQMDAYLEGTMSASERQSFEKELENNAELAEMLEAHRSAVLSIESVGVKADLQQIMAQNRAVKPAKVRSFNRTVLSIAASLLVLVGAFFILKSGAGSSAQKLYQAYYQTDPGLPTLMGSTDNALFDDAMVDFKSGDYDSALEKFNDLASRDATNDTLLFYQGVSSLEIGDTEMALTFLSQIDLTESTWAEKTEWTQAMIYLANDNVSGAQPLLEKIANTTSHRYRDRAVEVLDQLTE